MLDVVTDGWVINAAETWNPPPGTGPGAGEGCAVTGGLHLARFDPPLNLSADP